MSLIITSGPPGKFLQKQRHLSPITLKIVGNKQQQSSVFVHISVQMIRRSNLGAIKFEYLLASLLISIFFYEIVLGRATKPANAVREEISRTSCADNFEIL